MVVRRLSDGEIFLELKRALNPLLRDPIPLRRPKTGLLLSGLATATNVFGRWVDRNIFGFPMNVFLQCIVPVLSVPFPVLFEYGKPRGYLEDLFSP